MSRTLLSTATESTHALLRLTALAALAITLSTAAAQAPRRPCPALRSPAAQRHRSHRRPGERPRRLRRLLPQARHRSGLRQYQPQWRYNAVLSSKLMTASLLRSTPPHRARPWQSSSISALRAATSTASTTTTSPKASPPSPSAKRPPEICSSPSPAPTQFLHRAKHRIHTIHARFQALQ